MARDINDMVELFQKDEATINQIIESHPASYLGHVLQLHHKLKSDSLSSDDMDKAALYAGNSRWLDFLKYQFSNLKDSSPDSGHFAVTIPSENTEAWSEASILNDLSEIHVDQTVADDRMEAGMENLIEEKQNETAEFDNNETAELVNKETEAGKSFVSDGVESSHLDEDSQEVSPVEEVIELSVPGTPQPEQTSQEVAPVAELPSAIEFEPLHTVDYFASQGIKLTEADLSNDKLSQQVKSFTGWLKSMKKLHPGKLPEQDEVIQQIIQNASEASNVESDVLTEAMAEVLVKQNKKEKAIEMYEKLSLTNPSKSAYFAAKILTLKTS